MAPQHPKTQRPVSTGMLIFGLGLSQLIGWGALVHMFAAFITPMQAEMGWTTTQITGALTLALFIGDLVAIPVGDWVDKRGAHGVMTLGAVLGALVLAAWSAIDALWQLYLVGAGLGFAIATALGNNSSTVVTANVPDFRRALMLMAFLSGLAHSVMIPLAGFLGSSFGWRNALLIVAVMEFLSACLCAYVLRGTVGSRQARPDQPAKKEEGPSPLSRAVRRQAFWTLSIAFAIQWYVGSFHSVHILPMAQERGLPLDAALSIMAVSGPASVIGRMILYFFDVSTSARTTGRVIFPMTVVTLVVLITSSQTGFWGLIAYSALFGATNGVIVIVRQTAIAEIFGIRGYGAVTGAITTVAIIPRTASPLANSWLHDILGGYQPLLWLLAGLAAIATISFYIATMDRGEKV
jgi:MFS family permease